MRRLAVPVLSLAVGLVWLQAAFADEAPPLEAVWQLPLGPIGDPTLPASIASGSDGSVYVVEAGLNRVLKFGADGQVLERWGVSAGEAGALEKPFGIVVGSDDLVYVTEMGRARVRHFDAHGAELGSWGGFGGKDGRFREPRGITVNAEGHVFVVDGENHRIQSFNADGHFMRAWGEKALVSPVDIAVMPSGDLLVTDVGSRCIYRFTSQGNVLESWRPTDGFAAFDFWPQSIAVGANRTVFVTDPWAGQVIEFSGEGRFVRRWPDPDRQLKTFRIVPAQGTGEGVPPVFNPQESRARAELKTPLAVDVDASQRIFLIDRGLAQVRIYKP